MGSDNDNSDSTGVSTPSRSRPNEVQLQAGRIEVQITGYAEESELVRLASEQMERQMRQWVEVDRQVVATEPEGVLSLGGDR
ncbi:hypothetical protein DVK05_13310 [Halorubrum sp. Atlit-8R]|jgi:hypothetical protein|nr:hypothetical protein DVK08_15055 [Halorubrum sp. Atlit-9R]RLM77262.1 hypothetical protein DVK05_13310 [Halorubrum sp. Atlit-8R]